jgi:hypothetical protein
MRMTKQPFQVGDLVATNFPGMERAVFRVVYCERNDNLPSGWVVTVVDAVGACKACGRPRVSKHVFDSGWLSLVAPAPAAATTNRERIPRNEVCKAV